MMKPQPHDLAAALMRMAQQAANTQSIMQQAADEHFHAFSFQMREKLGAEQIALNEPYLESELAESGLAYLRGLRRLLDQIEPFVSQKALRPQAPIEPQIENELTKLDLRIRRDLKQRLDAHRQQQFGIRHYIWRTVRDDRVRNAHQANEGRIFRWDEGEFPGDAFGCRCFAEPLLDGAGVGEYQVAGSLVTSGAVVIEIALILSLINSYRAALEASSALPESDPQSPQQEDTTPATPPLPPLPDPEDDNEPERPEDEEEDEEEREEDLVDPKDILMPDGELYGESGNRPEYRVQSGGEDAAKELYEKLSKGGTPDTPPNYPGEGTRLPNGDWVGYRSTSKSGPPSVDVQVRGIDITKIKFLN